MKKNHKTPPKKITKYSIWLGIISAVVLFLFIGLRPSYGDSMTPTYKEGAPKFTIYRSIYDKEIERFDVVRIEMDRENNKKNYNKRIIGLPGEKIRYINGNVYVNDVLVENPYVKYKYKGGYNLTYTSITLGEDEYYVLGDNQAVEKDETTSYDSRFFGAVKDNEIVAFCLGGI